MLLSSWIRRSLTVAAGAVLLAASAMTPAHADAGANAADWEITSSGAEGDALAESISYCSGNFAPIRVVNNRLEWGAEQTCENPSDRPHWIVVKLEETCPQSWCIVFNTDAEVRSPAWEELTRVVRVAEADTCVDNDQRKIRVVVNAFARGGAGTATAISGEVLLDCDVD
ncbi:hypothetical protein [Catenuloplanes atrovinosus]|uniref:Secreted protein n=1 Tax=Catenuloplanes atrovinosus TaxID=137266 RepID=A0AAE3YLH0_9ACTN|nr:hypothetical protein [Catenuloplanes atrovinosus]MDR7276023.1 hypothetical protein [Catenuloplanes atrovinosus]